MPAHEALGQPLGNGYDFGVSLRMGEKTEWPESRTRKRLTGRADARLLLHDSHSSLS
jgi:hypothetical protein